MSDWYNFSSDHVFKVPNSMQNIQWCMAYLEYRFTGRSWGDLQVIVTRDCVTLQKLVANRLTREQKSLFAVSNTLCDIHHDVLICVTANCRVCMQLYYCRNGGRQAWGGTPRNIISQKPWFLPSLFGHRMWASGTGEDGYKSADMHILTQISIRRACRIIFILSHILRQWLSANIFQISNLPLISTTKQRLSWVGRRGALGPFLSLCSPFWKYYKSQCQVHFTFNPQFTSTVRE